MIVELFCFIGGVIFLANVLMIAYVIKHEKDKDYK